MRIALVSTSYPCSSEDPSGHFVRAEARALAAAGHDVHAVVPAADRSALGSDPITLWPVSHAGLFGWPGATSRLMASPWRAGGSVAFVASAVRALQRIQAQQVQAHWLVPCAFPIATSASSTAQVEAVAHGGDVRLLVAMPEPVRVAIVSLLIRRTHVLRFVAHSLLQTLAQSLPSALAQALMRRATVQPARLELPAVEQMASRLRQAANSSLLAVAAGRLVRSKRMDLAVRAANLVGPGLQLHVIGDGPEAARLRSLDQVGNVHFAGQLPREHALAWIAAANVLVHPSAAEAAPTVVREARLVGTPVIACDAGDVARWAKTDPGIQLVTPDALHLAEALRVLADRAPFPAAAS